MLFDMSVDKYFYVRCHILLEIVEEADRLKYLIREGVGSVDKASPEYALFEQLTRGLELAISQYPSHILVDARKKRQEKEKKEKGGENS